MALSKRYRKREPIEVEAVPISVLNIAEVAKWCGGRVIFSGAIDSDQDDEPVIIDSVGIKLRTERRLQVALIGDYVFQDHEGVFHKMTLHEFLFEYEPTQGDEQVVAETKENNE